MSKLFVILLLLVLHQDDCLRPIVVNTKHTYIVNNEGKIYKSSSSTGREDKIKSDLIINGDFSRMIRSGYSFPLGDTIVIELFETTADYHYLFDIFIVNGKYLIRYTREINDTEIVQKFKTIKSKLEFNSIEFSNGNNIRGHIEYIGNCVSGCVTDSKKVKIEGDFAIRINRYKTQ